MQTKIYKMGNKLGIYFPKNKQIYQKDDLILLIITKNCKEAKLIIKFNYNITIRKDFANKLKLKQNDIINIEISKIKNLERTKELFYNNKIDLLSLIPEKTSRGYEIIASKFFKNNEEWLRMWYYHNRGSGRQLELKRFIDIKKFGSLLGQYQAEGTKHKNTLRKFYVQFSNKLVEEHLDYLEYLKVLGIPKEKVEFKFGYNPKEFSKKIIDYYLNKFKEKINLRLKISRGKQYKGLGFSCVIRNVILTEIILNSMDKIRKVLANTKDYSKNQRILVNAFFAKLLTGDGTIDIKIDNREYDYPTTRIRVIDQDKEYLKDYEKIMENLGFIPKLLSKYISVRACCGIHHLLYLYKIKAFKNTNNWNKLLLNIDLALKGRRLLTLKRYLDLINYEKFDTLKIAKDYNICTRAAYDWLDNATKEGYIIKLTKRPIPNQPIIWTTSNKAKKLTNTLNLWQQDLTKLKEEKKIQDSLSLLNSLKVKGKN